MPGGLMDNIALRDVLVGDLTRFTTACRQRILIVTDGLLSFSPSSGFGLSRLVAAVRSYSPQPAVTLAHRSLGNHNETIGGTVFPVLGNFNFDTAATAVTTANYDQVWLFGFRTNLGGGQPGNVQPMAPAEIVRLATFMNAGGGLFATGDHGTLGQAMGSELPRVRRMREWSAIPMGLEGAPVARDRIDTVVDPGSPNGLYEFEDQSDTLPQRIYPNYRVTWSGPAWTATIHRLLAMPGAPANRTDSSGFTNDMDMMPDHPHESVCREVSASVNAAELNGTYNLHGQNFQEFPNASSGTGRIGSEIVAFGVSGGRSVFNNGWKPPVNPRMFGLISGFDGHAAMPYSGGVRPGRIVCDSTWHHFVNVNIDGTQSSRQGLGTGAGAAWTPNAACQKIFQYYRNIVAWLIPSNRLSCIIWERLVAVQLHPMLIEELVQLPDPPRPDQIEALGVEAARVLDLTDGPGAAVELVRAALRLDEPSGGLADSAEADFLTRSSGEAGPIAAYALGKAILELSKTYPLIDQDRFAKTLKGKKHEAAEADAVRAIAGGAAEAAEMQLARSELRTRQLAAVSPKRFKARRPG
jgi:hypothetical protein